MKELDVRLEMLPPMRVISAYGFGSSPESTAGEKMIAFLRSKELLEGYGTVIPHFGFNNPSPSSGSPNYGYEIWTAVPPDVEPKGDLKVVMFEGGIMLSPVSRTWRISAVFGANLCSGASAAPTRKPPTNGWKGC